MYAVEYLEVRHTDEYLEDVYNKVDAISLEEVDRLAHQPKTVVISCEMDLKYITVLSLTSSVPDTFAAWITSLIVYGTSSALSKCTRRNGVHTRISTILFVYAEELLSK